MKKRQSTTFGFWGSHYHTKKGVGYRFGFNSWEKEKGLGNERYTTFFRQVDTRLGRWWSIDPETKKYPGLSPYMMMNGNPVLMIDPLGNTIKIAFGKNESKSAYYHDGKLYADAKLQKPYAGKVQGFLQETYAALNKINKHRFTKVPLESDAPVFSVGDPRGNGNFTQVDKLISIHEELGLMSTDQEHEITISRGNNTLAFPYVYDIGNNQKEAGIHQDIEFNPNQYIEEIGTGKVLESYGALYHELSHIMGAISAPTKWYNRANNTFGKGSQYYNWTDEDEKYVIKRKENPLAGKDGMLQRIQHKIKGSLSKQKYDVKQ